MSSIVKTDNVQWQKEITTELVRKSIHMLVALVPPLAALNLEVTLMMLGSGVIFYAWTEIQRLEGHKVLFISYVTTTAARRRDMNGMVFGPITLAVGAMIALLLYPEPAAALAIYALAFGDGLSSIVGKTIGRVRIPLTGGKTIAGSLTCFFVIFFLALGTLPTFVSAAVVALIGTILEVIPSKDLDNIILPVGVGLITFLLMM